VFCVVFCTSLSFILFFSFSPLYCLSFFDIWLLITLGIFSPLYCLSFFDLCLLVTLLVSFCHCIVCPSLIYSFWLHFWYLFAIVLSVLLWFMSSGYTFGIFSPLYCLSFFDLCLLVTLLVSFRHCIVCPSLIYSFWLHFWYLFAIVSFVLLWFIASGYTFGIFSPLYCLSFFDLCLLVTLLVSFCHCIVCPSLIYSFWLHFWYLFAIVSSVLIWFMSSDYTWYLFAIVSSVLIWFMSSDYTWYLFAIVSSVLLWFMSTDYTFDIFSPLYRLSFLDL
jgi:hypothetical protein